MGKLTAEEKRQLEELTRKANSDDDDDDFEVVITEGERSVRIPYRKGRSWVSKHFGIDLETPETDDVTDNDATEDEPPADKPRTSQRYFGRKSD